MKIAIPVDNESMEANVSVSFGRSTYFLIYETDNQKFEYFKNEAANSQGGAGIKAAQFLVDANIDILLTPRCGENAANVFSETNIKLYQTRGTSIPYNLNAYLGGELMQLKEIGASLKHVG